MTMTNTRHAALLHLLITLRDMFNGDDHQKEDGCEFQRLIGEAGIAPEAHVGDLTIEGDHVRTAEWLLGQCLPGPIGDPLLLPSGTRRYCEKILDDTIAGLADA